MTDQILNLFRRRVKRPALDAVTADRLALMTYWVRLRGDAVRDMNRWRDSFRLRTGRAA